MKKISLIANFFKYYFVGRFIELTKNDVLDMRDYHLNYDDHTHITCKFVDLKLRTFDGIDISCLMITPIFDSNIHENKKYILYLNGNCHTRVDFRKNLEKLKPFLIKNYVFFILDYREYNTSEGEFTRNGVNYDINACIDHIYEQSGGENINIIGYSLGVATALEYIRFIYETEQFKQNIQKIGRLILIGGFSSLQEAVSDILGKIEYILDFFYLGSVRKSCLPFDYNGKNGIKYLNINNCLLVHSKNDNAISFKNFFRLRNANHLNYIIVEGDHFSYFKNDTLIIRCLEFL